MQNQKPLSPEEQALLDEGWQELGQSIAAAVVAGGKSRIWAWNLLGPLGLYKRWMLDAWIERYEQEHPPVKVPKKRGRKPTGAKYTRSRDSVFTKREQIRQALELLKKQMYG
jgi:hypothetical protein